jgi:hypothetical protein
VLGSSRAISRALTSGMLGSSAPARIRAAAGSAAGTAGWPNPAPAASWSGTRGAVPTPLHQESPGTDGCGGLVPGLLQPQTPTQLGRINAADPIRDSLQTNRPQRKGSLHDSRESPVHVMRRRGSAKASLISGTVRCAAMSAVRSTRACAARRVRAGIAPAVWRSCPPPPPP